MIIGVRIFAILFSPDHGDIWKVFSLTEQFIIDTSITRAGRYRCYFPSHEKTKGQKQWATSHTPETIS
jgi:hypothetical protein